jgi:hypothetical protein
MFSLCRRSRNLPTLRDFVDLLGLRDAGFRHLSLVEGNDQRFIDVGVISKLPLAAVVSYNHRRHPESPRTAIFSRELAQVEILTRSRACPF